MKKITSIIVVTLLFVSNSVMSQSYPTIAPTATYTSPDNEEPIESDNISASAPINVLFEANPQDDEGWTSNYEWRFTKEGADSPYLIRYDQDTEFTFTESGLHRIVCYAKFTKGNDEIVYDKEYWEDNTPLQCVVSESKLEMPNAFSPNGDGINDIYKAKDSVRSLVEFHAYIYNRWGQLLFEWTNPQEGWDGTHKGTPVKEGVYYCLVRAKGADGIHYNIKRDVNLLRGFTERGSTNE